LAFRLQISPAETLNGGTVDDFAKYGLADIVKTPNGKRQIVLSKPMLCILNETDHLTHLVPPILLRTVRDYHGDTQELAQLHSLAASYNAIALMKVNRPALTMANLRPGAVRWTKEHQAAGASAAAAAASVLDKELATTEEIEAAMAHNSPLKMVVCEKRCNPPPSPPATGAMAGIFKSRREKAVDAWVYFSTGDLLLMQTKGEVADRVNIKKKTISATDAAKFVASAGSVADDMRCAACEILFTHRSPNIEDNDKASHTALIITRSQMDEALGPVFSGMITRGADTERSAPAQL